ncbi:MAG TPA: NAD(P)/FAD-dependent oxidoreductase [Solirubrobacteraceae bacterium]
MTELVDLLVVGGGPAALATARAYRGAGGSGTVTLVAAENRLPYRRPPLTKELLRGELSPEELPIEREDYYTEHEVRVLRGARATALDPERRTVTVEGYGELGYATCVLATGSIPARPAVPGAEDPGLHVVREVGHALALQRHGPRVAVVGSGFIGCEAAASLAMRGAAVTLISLECVPQVERLGDEVGARLAAWLAEHGVALELGVELDALERREDGWAVLLAGEREVGADTVLLATGVRPATDLAEAAGMPFDKGAVACDERLATPVDGLFAAGDVACARNAAAGRSLRVEHWGEALTHGEVAGRAIAGAAAAWDNAPGFWSTIGRRTLKQVAWGDGWDAVDVVDHPGGGWTAWYACEGRCVGVLCHEADDDYERGRELVESGAPIP